MKRDLILLILVLIFSNIIYAQRWPKLSWYKTYNGPGDGVDIVQDVKFHNQNFYLTGRSSGPDTSQDLLILKYSDKGDSLLGIRYTANLHSWDEAASIAIDSHENIYIVGSSTFDQNTFYAMFQKYSPEGNLIFARNFNSDSNVYSEGVFVTLDSDEDPVMAYNRTSACVAKYSSSGDSIWTVTFSDDTSDYSVNYLLTDQIGNIYACLIQLYWDGGDLPTSNAVIVKLNKDGEVIWQTPVVRQVPGKILLDKEGNIILITSSPGKTIKLDTDGNTQWTNDETNSQYPIEVQMGLVVDSDNNIIVAGYEFGNSSWDYRTKKISPDGADIWSNDFESPEGLNDFAMDVALDGYDNVYVTGETHNSVSVGMCYTATYSKEGDPGWVFKFDPPNSTFELGFRIFIGDSDFVYVGGETGEPGFGPDFLAFKIDYGYGNDVKLVNNNIPKNFLLSQNYPNPFNPVTKIEFSIPRGDNVKIEIYDALGRLVEELVNRYFSAGNYSVGFDASKLSSGIYFYRLTSGSFTQMKKAVLLK